MKRVLFFVYGVISYSLFFGVFCYLPGFLGNFLVPKSIDSPASVPFGEALLVNTALLGLFAIQHSVMARQGFKKWWTKFIPKPIERSTYVLLASLIVILLYWQWRPMGVTIWNITDPTLVIVFNGLMILGGLIVLVTTFLINHFDLFGLRQVWLYLIGKKYTNLGFVVPGPYKLIRHPLYFGWLLMFWATPVMTIAHLVFAVATTGYIFVAIWFEEKDLITIHGRDYAEYKKRTPMIFPFGKKQKEVAQAYDKAA
jgi:protein-S-isoprenylcysteine O-methyltransferase Ste14